MNACVSGVGHQRFVRLSIFLLAACVGTLLSGCAASSGSRADAQSTGESTAPSTEKNYLNTAEALDEFYKQRQQPATTNAGNANTRSTPTPGAAAPTPTQPGATQPGTMTAARPASTAARERAAAAPERPARVYPAPTEPTSTTGGELEANASASMTNADSAAGMNNAPGAGVVGTKPANETNDQKRQRLVNELVELAAIERAAPNEENVALRRAVKMVLASALAGDGASAASRADVQTASLPPRDAAAVDALRELIRESQNPTAAGDGAALSRAIERAAAKAAASQGLSLAQLQLCTRVDGYGKYISLDGAPIVAGRPLAALVYTEVENFSQTSAGTGGEYSVNLSQEVRLYTEAGTPVWSRPKQTSRDSSKNRRRDFFLVQRIEIPGNLAPGRYDLKVTVRDEDASAISERSVPITVVADTTSKAGVPARTK